MVSIISEFYTLLPWKNSSRFLPPYHPAFSYMSNYFEFDLINRASLIFVELPGVLWVLPDSYLDVPNKDYGGWWIYIHKTTSQHPSFFHFPSVHLLHILMKWWYLGDLFVDGKVIHRPQYQFSERQQNSRSRPRPRHDRRRETMQVQRPQNQQQSPAGQPQQPGPKMWLFKWELCLSWTWVFVNMNPIFLIRGVCMSKDSEIEHVILFEFLWFYENLNLVN